MLRDQSMPEVALRPRSLWSARLLQLALVAGLLALGALAWWALGIAHWRHDSFAYSSEREIWFKIRSEGRWLNYLAWWCLRSVSPHLAWGANLCMVGGALYLIISRLVEDRLVAAVLAITLLLFPGFHDQNLWPLYTLVGSAAFLVSVLLIQRHGWIWVVPGCVLICGAVQYAVFLLPLAVLPLSKESASSGLLRGALLGLYWAAGATLGMLISCAVNSALFGVFGIRFASWRIRNPATDLSSLMDNLKGCLLLFVEHVGGWLPVWSMLLLGGALLASALAGKLISRSVPALLVPLSFCFVVMLSPYLAVVPSGLSLLPRSVLPMAAGLVLMPFLVLDRSAHRAMALVVFVAVSAPSFSLSRARVEWFAAYTQINVTNVEAGLSREARTYAGVVVDTRRHQNYFEGVDQKMPAGLVKPRDFDGLNHPARLVPAFLEVGFAQVRTISDEEDPGLRGGALSASNSRMDGASDEGPDGQSGQVRVLGERENWLMVRLVP